MDEQEGPAIEFPPKGEDGGQIIFHPALHIMKAKPEKQWHQQTWVIPHEMRLERIGENWFLTALGMIKIPIDAQLGQMWADAIELSWRKDNTK